MRLAILLLACVRLLAAVEPIADEAIRLEVLAKFFSGLFVRPMPSLTADTSHTVGSRHPIPFPDAFAGEKVYQVTGQLVTDLERCAGANQASKALSIREVRLQLYRWPVGAPSELLAVVQYRFPNAKPDYQCTSIGFLAHLTGEGADRELLETKFLEAWSHHAIQSVQLVDLTGDGVPELLIESDVGDALRTASLLYVYDLSEGDFHQLLAKPTRWHGEPEEDTVWTQTLDIPRTLREHGKRFCFEKTLYADSGKWFPSPRINRPCYPPEAEK